VVLYVVGMALLIAELFLPAHGTIGLVGLAVLGYGLFRTFQISDVAGVAGLLVVAVALPVGLIVSVKNWHRTPIGRRISPPNPVLTDADRLPTNELAALIGKRGRTLTLLRPVGTCLFEGRRVECTSEQDVIKKGVLVEAVRLVDRTVSVRPVPGADETANGSGRDTDKV